MNKTLTTIIALSTIGCASSYLPEPEAQRIEPSAMYENVAIFGPEEYTTGIAKALDIIYFNDPENWRIVNNNVNLIRLNPPSGMHVRTGILDTDDNKTTAERYQPLEWIAGEIVHDAWHREYFRRGEAYNNWEGELKCLERQNEFFQKINHPLLDIPFALSTHYWETRRDW